MKRLSSRKLRLNYRIILQSKGKTIVDCRKQIKSKIIKLLSTNKWSNGYLMVDYGRMVGCNESYHTNAESMKRALRVYTEKNLLDFLLTNMEAK